MKGTIARAAMLVLLAAPIPSHAGELVVPHKPGDRIEVHVQPVRYAHPVDYWWHLDPTKGSWDYFTPVTHLHQPVPLERPAVDSGPKTARQSEPAANATIPVTPRPQRQPTGMVPGTQPGMVNR